jgi:pilus assembly protein CpaB
MKRRIIGIVGAIALASIGTIALVAYVQSARDEAVAAEAMVSVYLVDSAIAEGTPGEEIKASIEESELPARMVAEGSVQDLADLDGLVTNTQLLPGEQLVRGRFVTPSVARQGDVPPGLLQVTVELEPQRALGGQIRAGDRVAVLLSFGDRPVDPTDMTHLELHKVLVTKVQIAENATGVPTLVGADDDEDEVATAPTESLLVTLALDASSVEQVVFAGEFGMVWLANEPPDAPEDGTRIVGSTNMYDVLVPQ